MTQSTLHLLPVARGIYALALRLSQSQVIWLRHHNYLLPPGLYLYVGSAQGAGGIRARLGRHLRGDGRPRWHIDALRAVAEVVGWQYALDDTETECEWAQALACIPHSTIPVPGFGASDCRRGCAAHLVHLPLTVELQHVWACLPDSPRII